MPVWDKKQPRCENCRTNRRPRRWRGYCKRCYPIILKIDRLRDGRYKSRGRYPKLSPSILKIRIKQAEWELTQIRNLESPLIDYPSGWDIEGLITTLARVSNSQKAREYANCYKIFENMIDKMQDGGRTTYCSILLKIFHVMEPESNTPSPRFGEKNSEKKIRFI